MVRDLIVFGEDWGGLPSSTQHLVRFLAQDRKVIWVNSIGLRRPTLSLHDVQRAWRKLTATKIAEPTQSNVSTPDNFTIVNPTTLPAPQTVLGRKIAANMLKKQLRPIIQSANLNDPILWTSLPTAIDVAELLDTSSLVYYCGDDFGSLAGVDHSTVVRREEELVAKADLILAASEKLQAKFPKDRTQLLPHGVDYALFSSPTSRALDLPSPDKPVAGFYGSLSEWLDYDLLEQVIQSLPNWQFVFIGNTCDRADQMRRFENALFLGPKPHHQLPQYSQHWTASLLPFKNNAQINACNPLKLREYLAAGRPVISTPFPALESYREFVSVVNDAEQFVEALNNAVDRQPNAEQQHVLANQTWQSRAEQLDRWLEAL
ncbi:glycosyltransferase family protein [Enterovibrio coralii]|uniref:Glycosyl transferase n=1 Tax=Enterovibrio coralii TaxID=294935 RepID=A0A135IDH7_9GAMM|nr:glycosyltransferase [Enterovibrio coralii]KXF83509.1 glycosyl transferase [Enterovibrio coralii]